MRAYYNLIEGLWRLGEYRQALGYLEQGEYFGRDQDFRVYGYMFAARRCRLALMRGQWAEAEAGLRELLEGQDDPGMIGRETVPVLARVLVRQGNADAPQWLALAARHAARADVLEWLVPTGLAHIEYAWLTGDHGQAGPYPELLLERTDRPGMLVQRGELLVYLRRLGYPAKPCPGCQEPYASALRGTRSAANAWFSEGDPRAGCRACRVRQVAPTLEALAILDGLGATPAVAIVRNRLRGLGVARLPHRPQPGTLITCRVDRSPARDPAIGRGRAIERGNRAPVGGITSNRGPPRFRRLAKARRALQTRGRGPGRRAPEQPSSRGVI
jgi:hypothetical protein